MKTTSRAHRILSAESLEKRQLLHGAPVDAAEPPSTEQRVEAAFERFDENNDLLLTQDEVSTRHWARLSDADLDDNGIAPEELVAHLDAQPAERDGPQRIGRRDRGGGFNAEDRLDNLFADNDGNEDGLLTADEVSERLWERLSPADSNDDGVSREELEAYQEARRAERMDAFFAQLDANEDGGITADEVSERRWEKLVGADANEDAAVTQDELREFLDAQGADAVADEPAARRGPRRR